MIAELSSNTYQTYQPFYDGLAAGWGVPPNSTQDYQNTNCDDFLPLNIPKGVSVDRNMRTAAEMRNTLSRFDNPNRERNGGSFPAFDIWFKEQVQDKAPWDYKYLTPDHKVYEPFGNFNYGATGAAAGYSLDTLYRVAGWIQQHGGDASTGSGTTSPTLLDAYLGRGGSYPYGDASLDAGYIQQGYSYAKCKEAQGRR